MSRATYIALGVATGIGFILWNWGVAAPIVAAGWIFNVFDRGSKLSDSTVVNGVVSESPEVLLDQASAVLGFTADQDTYSLARMGRSEGVDGMEYRMHVLLNDLYDLQTKYGSTYATVTELLVHSKIPGADGRYSTQALGKRYATTRDPYEGDYLLAQKVLNDRSRGIDIADGATKFVDKSGPFYIDHQEATYAELVSHWGASGFVPIDNLPGTTSNFVIFKKADA